MTERKSNHFYLLPLSSFKMHTVQYAGLRTQTDLPTPIPCKSGVLEKKLPKTWRFPQYVSNKTKKADYFCHGIPNPISGLCCTLLLLFWQWREDICHIINKTVSSYCQTQKTVITWKISGMSIVYWPITIKTRTREQTQNHKRITVAVCSLVILTLIGLFLATQ